MVYVYSGHFQYSRLSVMNNAPDDLGVYYVGYLDSQRNLIPRYVGRAAGDGVSIRGRLLNHLRDDAWWTDVTHFGYRICSTKREAEDLEEAEIKRLQPKCNTQGNRLFARY